MNNDSTTIPSAELSELRKKIDTLDAQVLSLLAERCSLAERVIDAKDSTADSIRHPQREESLLRERIAQGRAKGLDGQFVMRVFHELIAESVRVQQGVLQQRANTSRMQGEGSTNVAFQGIDGTFSHLGGRAFFSRTPSSEPSFVGYPSFEAVVHAVESGACAYGVLPIENTTAGAINDVYDLLLNSRLSVVGEEKLKVSYGLIGTAGVSPLHVTRILCSPLAVAECSAFLGTLPECRIEYVTDSALAVKRVKEGNDPSVAAIASTDTAPLFGLSVLSDTIANHTESFTRYLIVSRTPITVDSRVPSKTSIVLHTTNQPGALVEALAVFKEHGINLTKLESRPVPGNSWEEMFYIDFVGNLGDENVKTVLGELTRKARFIKVLGCYPRCDIEATEVTDAHELAQELAAAPSLQQEAPAAPKAASKDKGYKLASREYKRENTVINVGGVSIGDGNFLVIAGPCSVESREQIFSCAKESRDHGAKILRGGVFKPRTSPYSFQGMGYEGLDLLVEAGKTYGLPVITEVMTTEDVVRVAEKADIIQIGARNMQNFSLLKAVGEIRRPVMLKRGMSSSIDEMLQAVEYILAGGNQQVFLCERGIRTFETATRGTLDISAVPVLKARTHLPVFIDPSHAAGVRELVPPLALAAKAVGADGIIVEFHPEPEEALSDGPQALRYPQFEKLMTDLRQLGAPAI